MAGDRGRPDIDRHAERRVDEARPDRDSDTIEVDRDGDRAVIVCRGLVRGAQHGGAPCLHGHAVGANDGLTDQFGDRLGVPQHRLRHVDVEQGELRIDHQPGQVDRLANDLLVHLAL